MTEGDRKVSEHLVRLIQIIFGFVLAQSLGRYGEVVLHPLEAQNRLQAFALLTIYATTVLSWIDWHLTMVLRPYNLNPKAGNTFLEQLRVFSDLFVVSIYAYVLLTVEALADASSADATPYLAGFVWIFAGYVISGVLRKLRHGHLASNLSPILVFVALYSIVLLGYNTLISGADRTALNYFAVGAAFALMLTYRSVRRILSRKKQERKESGLRIGIDVDGVLANQINGVIPRIKRRLGVDIAYEDVTAWRLPISTSDIAEEIRIAMLDNDYILSMPCHIGAKAVMTSMSQDNQIKIITARPPSGEEATRVWLESHGIPYDSISSIKEREKSFLATDVLVDDYIGNIIEYLSSTNGTGILVDQPWNRERNSVHEYIRSKRLYIVQTLLEIDGLIRKLREQQNTL